MSKFSLIWGGDKESDTPDSTLKRGVRALAHLLEDGEFRDSIKHAIKAGESIAKEARYEAANNSVTDALRDQITAQRKELDSCLRDYHNFAHAHASSYAARRYKELHDKLQELDKA